MRSPAPTSFPTGRRDFVRGAFGPLLRAATQQARDRLRYIPPPLSLQIFPGTVRSCSSGGQRTPGASSPSDALACFQLGTLATLGLPREPKTLTQTLILRRWLFSVSNSDAGALGAATTPYPSLHPCPLTFNP